MTRDEELGRRISELRAGRGLSEEELAEALRLDSDTVRGLEQGQKIVTSQQLADLAALFALTPAQLLAHPYSDGTALLRAGWSSDESIQDAVETLNACIAEYRGVMSLAQ